MRELEALEVVTAALVPGHEDTQVITHPYPHTVLLSHLEVTALSPHNSAVLATDLRVDRLFYLLAPVPLQLLRREQHLKIKHHEHQQLQLLQQLLPTLGPLGALRLLHRGRRDRRSTRLIALDIRWKPDQPLSITLKNAGTVPADRISIELVLYAFEDPLSGVN